MDLATLTADISDDLNRGNITSSQIRAKIRSALLLLEMQNTWGYMDRLLTFTLDIASEQPRALPMPGGVKSFEFLRLRKPGAESDGFCWHKLVEASPRDFDLIDTGMPNRYFKDAMQYIWLDRVPKENYPGELSYKQYTQWSDTDGFSPWPFQYMTPVIKYQTLVLMAPFIRDPEFMQMNVTLLGLSMKAAVDANEELEYSNRDNQMVFK